MTNSMGNTANRSADIARIECLADLEVAAHRYYREPTSAGAEAVDVLVDTYMRFPCCPLLTNLARSWRNDRSGANRMAIAPQLSKYASYAQR